ncbi:hypothetical protein PENTCL1PPCAC_9879 [Pristionchus entomophagus]|uniref:G protein-coupled receptor n=1 Tax=Pristionchus entomophagus TaxID=358040 RepID=A0AAV5T287_9BILA|nr:hypothetical protein PENTCL1PPCAC_9879 [Pristionchus entomophagus]
MLKMPLKNRDTRSRRTLLNPRVLSSAIEVGTIYASGHGYSIRKGVSISLFLKMNNDYSDEEVYEVIHSSDHQRSRWQHLRRLRLTAEARTEHFRVLEERDQMIAEMQSRQIFLDELVVKQYEMIDNLNSKIKRMEIDFREALNPMESMARMLEREMERMDKIDREKQQRRKPLMVMDVGGASATDDSHYKKIEAEIICHKQERKDNDHEEEPILTVENENNDEGKEKERMEIDEKSGRVLFLKEQAVETAEAIIDQNEPTMKDNAVMDEEILNETAKVDSQDHPEIDKGGNEDVAKSDGILDTMDNAAYEKETGIVIEHVNQNVAFAYMLASLLFNFQTFISFSPGDEQAQVGFQGMVVLSDILALLSFITYSPHLLVCKIGCEVPRLLLANYEGTMIAVNLRFLTLIVVVSCWCRLSGTASVIKTECGPAEAASIRVVGTVITAGAYSVIL